MMLPPNDIVRSNIRATTAIYNEPKIGILNRDDVISKHGQRNDAKSIVVQCVHCKKIDCKRYHIVGSQVMQHCSSKVVRILDHKSP
jgi:hypothetical protein